MFADRSAGAPSQPHVSAAWSATQTRSPPAYSQAATTPAGASARPGNGAWLGN